MFELDLEQYASWQIEDLHREIAERGLDMGRVRSEIQLLCDMVVSSVVPSLVQLRLRMPLSVPDCNIIEEWLASWRNLYSDFSAQNAIGWLPDDFHSCMKQAQDLFRQVAVPGNGAAVPIDFIVMRIKQQVADTSVPKTISPTRLLDAVATLEYAIAHATRLWYLLETGYILARAGPKKACIEIVLPQLEAPPDGVDTSEYHEFPLAGVLPPLAMGEHNGDAAVSLEVSFSEGDYARVDAMLAEEDAALEAAMDALTSEPDDADAAAELAAAPALEPEPEAVVEKNSQAPAPRKPSPLGNAVKKSKLFSFNPEDLL